MNLRTLALLACALAACTAPGSTPDEKAAQQTRDLAAEGQRQVGMPAVNQFTELRNAKNISELRDQAIRTWTYYVDIEGRRHLLCESVGFGLPYSVQITNPERVLRGDEYPGQGPGGTIPQSEPNGLFMPDNAQATWVLCSDGKGGVAPVYSEPELLVSPFPLGHVDAAQNSGFADTVSIQRVPSHSP